tara:strand:- start:18417 stop:19421 length:1005 start_codon:yes stop_codon:yes gene_type:complete
MFALVDACDIEISAMGFLATNEDKKKAGVKEDFYISEFRPSSQSCTGTYTEMDSDGLTDQLMSLKDEGWENPGKRRAVHFHSHVNMGVSQSGVDEQWIETIAGNELLGDVGIFIIANKKRELNVRVEMFKPFRQTFERCTWSVDQINILPDGWGEEMVEKYVTRSARTVETLTSVKRAGKNKSWYSGYSDWSRSSRPIVTNGSRVLHGNRWMWESDVEEEEAPEEEVTTRGYEYRYDDQDIKFPDELVHLQDAYDGGDIDSNEAVQLFGKWCAKELSTEEVEQELEEVHNYTLVGNPDDKSDEEFDVDEGFDDEEEESAFGYMTDPELLKKGVC